MSAPGRRFKVVFLGDSGVGKTSIIKQRIGCGFDIRMSSTYGIDQQLVNVSLPGEQVLLLVIDTAGQEQFRSITPMYVRDCTVACLVASIVDEDSLKNLVGYWSSFLNEIYVPPVIAVVVNKTDLAVGEDIERAERILKEKFDLVHYVSALRNENINALFEAIANRAIAIPDPQPPPSGDQSSQDRSCC
jgi:small GTP-binding protein